ncbi:ParA family protein [Actinomadura kijaniata]|uniref:Chromosome partitioning protein n=1 Tax=Actinomadura namibiensis TaxID=182080 RepID=A0A7W3QSD0_ACTNM|nr:ParA family protein [Actinomadura namibiensis]MBA8957719.1 chromosome partitioning protein [Actinomadura namibiensis]
MAAPPHWAIATHKGGTGKSKLIELIAAAAAEKGDRVLVVDMDAQANITRRLRAQIPAEPAERRQSSLASVLERPGKGEIARVLVPSGWGGVYSERITVAPGHLDLELLALTAGQPSSSRRLLTALAGVVDDFDLVLIDCPPNLLSHLIDNAWTASDLLWVPVEPEFDAVEAARRVVERVERDRDLLNPDLAVAGFVINRFRSQLTLHKQRAEETAGIISPAAVCPVRFPELVALKNGSEFAQPMSELGTEGRAMATLGADAYAWMTTRGQMLMGAAA